MIDDNTIQPFNPVSVGLQESNLIEASAGTGKTYSIAILTLRLVLEKKISIQQILMVTFTKAAVAELETRIRQFMRKALRYCQGAIINDETITNIVQASIDNRDIGGAGTERLLREAVLFLDETVIITIHSFCQRVLTEFAFETRQIFGSEILLDVKSIITDRVNAFWRKHITTLDTALLNQLINAGLARDKLVKVLENALSGKAMIMLGDLPAGFLSAAHQAAVYASVKGFNDNIEAINTGILRYISLNIDAIRSATEKNNHAKKNLGHLLHDHELFLESVIENKSKAYVQKLYPEILSDHERIESVEEEKINFLKGLINQVYHLAIKIISVETERHKQQHNQLGFDDMITKLHDAVVVKNDMFLISSLQAKYKAAFIDEFQDTDKMQYEIFNRLFGSNAVLFYIGDPKQSIYAWRKADIFTYFKAKDAVANCFGMNINYRSSNRFIDGMNHFFQPSAGFDTFYFPDEANAINYINVAAPGKSELGELYKNGVEDIPLTIFENANNESISQTVAAQIIQLLSDDNYTIREKGRHRKLRPSDIGILVRKNKQAAEIKRLLCKVCIPAITIDDTKLLETDEARNLLYLLEAVININSSGINKALLSPLTGFSRADILSMDDELALDRFKDYQHLWENEGVYVMLAKFMADYNVKEVLLNQITDNGERIITNVSQLMELLHKIQTQKRFSSIELANWLKRGIEGMPVEGDEFEQRVESDEEAVKIVTIHKSKGLEYNIVFAPFLDLLADTDFDFVTFRDDVSGDYLFSEKSFMDAAQLQQTARQLEQENRRLIYVAITRAVYKCYINKNNFNKFNRSAITPFINAVKDFTSPLIAFESSPVVPAYFRYPAASRQLKPAYLQAGNFLLTEVNWRKLSYTYLGAGHSAVLKPHSKKVLSPYDEFVFSILQRGALTGNLLHFIFERVDFTDAVFWEKTIGEGLKRFMPNAPAGYTGLLFDLLHHVTAAAINIGGSLFQLAELPNEKRLNELEFDFTVAPFDAADISKLSTIETPFGIRNASELEGIMNGKIDLFFEQAGKYFILDWKSSFLGNSIDDYSKENIISAMADSNYHLQYLIYTIAVRKYLQLRIPGFSYASHFGGVIYLFVRGIRKGYEHGIFTCKPDEDLIDNLDKILSK